MVFVGAGAFMAQRKKFITCGYYLAVLAMVMRFLIGPIVMLVSSFAVGLQGVFLNVGVVQVSKFRFNHFDSIVFSLNFFFTN